MKKGEVDVVDTNEGSIRASEVTRAGHPDKVADHIADQVLARLQKIEPTVRTGIEVIVTGDQVLIAGEASHDLHGHVFDAAGLGLDGLTFEKDRPYEPRVRSLLQPQTAECAATVSRNRSGDQTIAIGYANGATPDRLPPAHSLARHLAAVCDTPAFMDTHGLLSDGKLLVVLPGTPSGCVRIQCNVQHLPDWSGEATVSQAIADHAGNWLGQSDLCGTDVDVSTNPGASFLRGGSYADTGVTGRKLVADLYGPAVPVGGGALSGKDLSKLDRSATYAARQLALTARQHTGARTVLTALVYGRGSCEPLSATVTADGDRDHAPAVALALLTPEAIVTRFAGWQKHLSFLAAGGHVGTHHPGLPWERIDPDLLR